VNKIEIWQPRYHDRVALVAKRKVREDNIIVFTKDNQLLGKKFRMSGWKIMKYPLESNGKIPCYAVKLDDLEEENNEVVK